MIFNQCTCNIHKSQKGKKRRRKMKIKYKLLLLLRDCVGRRGGLREVSEAGRGGGCHSQSAFEHDWTAVRWTAVRPLSADPARLETRAESSQTAAERRLTAAAGSRSVRTVQNTYIPVPPIIFVKFFVSQLSLPFGRASLVLHLAPQFLPSLCITVQWIDLSQSNLCTNHAWWI